MKGSTAAQRRFDVSKAQSATTYPVCARLSLLYAQQGEEEKRRYDVEQGYQTLLDADLLHCGKERVGWGIMGKKHNEQWRQGCIAEILPAKRRLLGFLQDLCDEQQRANAGPAATAIADALVQETSRGVVYTGKGEHLKDILQSVLGLRLLNVSLPVEIWVNARDEALCGRIFHAPLPPAASGQRAVLLGPTACRALPNTVTGFASKFYALQGTAFRHALFVDADNLAVRDVTEVFDSEEYRRTGALVWPDLWGERCRTVKGQTNGETGYQTHVLWAAGFGGLQWHDTRDCAQEAEAGQLALDLWRHGGLLELGRRFIEDRRFFKRVVNGDKDIFRFAHLLTGEPFFFVPHLPGYSVPSPGAGGRDCLVHFLGPPGDALRTASPLFFHQLKSRDPDAFRMARRWPEAHRDDASACVDLSARPELPPLQTLPFPDAERLRAFALSVFRLTDSVWEASAGGRVSMRGALAYHEAALGAWDAACAPRSWAALSLLLLVLLLMVWRRWARRRAAAPRKN